MHEVKTGNQKYEASFINTIVASAAKLEPRFTLGSRRALSLPDLCVEVGERKAHEVALVTFSVNKCVNKVKISIISTLDLNII